MEHQIHLYIQGVMYDLHEACLHSGEPLCAEGLADAIGDHMHDTSAEFRALSNAEQDALTLKVAKQYV